MPAVMNESRINDMHYSVTKNELFLLVCEASNVIKMYLDSTDMRELTLIKILNGSIDALYYEMSYGGRHEVVPPIANPSASVFSNDSNDSRERTRLTSAQVKIINIFNKGKASLA